MSCPLCEICKSYPITDLCVSYKHNHCQLYNKIEQWITTLIEYKARDLHENYENIINNLKEEE